MTEEGYQLPKCLLHTDPRVSVSPCQSSVANLNQNDITPIDRIDLQIEEIMDKEGILRHEPRTL